MLSVAVLLKFYKGEISPFDEAALECALCLPHSSVTLLAMSPIANKQRIEHFTRLGASRAILISDPAFAGSDTLATAKVLAAALKKINPDLVLCGRQSMDGDTAQIPPEAAALTGYNLITNALECKASGRIRTRLGEREIVPPCVISVERIKTLRLPALNSRTVAVEVWDNSMLRIPAKECGLTGSPTRVLESVKRNGGKRSCEFIKPEQLREVIDAALEKPYVISKPEQSGKRLKTIHIVGGGLEEAAAAVAEKIIRIPVYSPEKLAEAIRCEKAENVLFKATLQNRALAPQVAALLNAGLAADCIRLQTDGERLFMYRPAIGGNVVAKIGCNSLLAMATVREREANGADIVFGIGAGAVDFIPQITAVAKEYNAEIAASRKIVDLGLLPYESQVGLTGRIIAPKVYVAFGISGAVQHLAGMENAQTVIAINQDKKASIFDYADYGIVSKLEGISPC